MSLKSNLTVWQFPLIAILIFIVSCQDPVENNSDALVQVGESILTYSDLEDMMPDGVNEADSAMLADRFVDSWIKNQVILQQAENNLPEKSKDFEKKIADYRNSLLTYAFEKAIVDQKLDTLVSDEEILLYYNENKDNFQLKDYVVKARFCIFREGTEVPNDFKSLLNSEESEDLVSLEQFCVENDAVYYLDDEQWLYYSELLETVPVQSFNVERFLKNNKFVKFEEDEKLYFLKLSEYKLKDGLSPLSLQSENIKNIIINQRKNILISNMKDDLYKEALEKGKIKRFKE